MHNQVNTKNKQPDNNNSDSNIHLENENILEITEVQQEFVEAGNKINQEFLFLRNQIKNEIWASEFDLKQENIEFEDDIDYNRFHSNNFLIKKTNQFQHEIIQLETTINHDISDQSQSEESNQKTSQPQHEIIQLENEINSIILDLDYENDKELHCLEEKNIKPLNEINKEKIQFLKENSQDFTSQKKGNFSFYWSKYTKQLRRISMHNFIKISIIFLVIILILYFIFLFYLLFNYELTLKREFKQLFNIN